MILDGVLYRYAAGGRFTLGPLDLEGPDDRPWLVLGPTGSGKTTLLRILGGATKPDRGKILGGGGADAAYLPQLPERALAGRNLAEDLSGDVRPPQARRARLRNALEEVGLRGIALSRRSRDLSAGERRRLALALLVLAGRRGWALDEPEAGLDVVGTRLLVHVLERRCGGGRRCWIGTHRPEVYRSLDPWVVVLDGGRCLGAGEWADLARGQRVAEALGLAQRPTFRLRKALRAGNKGQNRGESPGTKEGPVAQVFALLTDRDSVS